MNSEEQIQRQIEEGQPIHGADANAYRAVFRALKIKPDVTLPADFAVRVAAVASVPKKSFGWDQFFLVCGILGFSIAMIYAIVVTGFSFSLGAFQFLNTYHPLVLFGIVFVAVINWIDSRFIHKKEVRVQ